MKTLKTIFILTVFSTLIVSCSIDDITDTPQTTAKENIHATGNEKKNTVDKTEKG